MTNHCPPHSQQAKTISVPLKVRNKTWTFVFTFFIQHITGSPITAIRQEEIKGIQLEKEVVKLSLFADDIILYIENPKDSTKKLLEMINKFRKETGHTINIHRSVALLYANNERTEREFKKTIPFTTA